jgi:ribosomal protein L37AE/L43A
LIATSNRFYSCPKCGEITLLSHRKTYERTIIFFCNNCRFSKAFEPSKEAYFDIEKAFEDFKKQYREKQAQIEQ